MIVELAAVRVVAPYFGASSIVWTNVIGVVLGALALGYLVGARAACGVSPRRTLGLALALGACAAALVPFFAREACRWFVPEGLALHEAFELVAWGSLAATIVLFAPVALLLGTASPLFVETWQRASGESAGTVGGRVLGASTLGGLAGAFATPHWLVPEWGLHATYWSAAAALALACALVASPDARGARPGVRSLLIACALGSGVMNVAEPSGRPDVVELAARESPYQSVRVVEDRSSGEPLRLLQVNEGLDSFQSVWKATPGLLGEGYYYDAFALPPAWSGASGRWRVLVLGLGAGTTFRVLDGSLPQSIELDAWGVEIDPVVVELGRRWFELREDPRHHVVAGVDARVALRSLAGPWDEIVLDAYANQIEIPAHLSTREFFREARDALAPGGWLAINVGSFGCDDPLLESVAGSVAAAFASDVLAIAVPASRNVVLFARRDAPLPLPGAPAEGARPDWRAPDVDAYGLLSKTTHPANRRIFGATGAAPLDDDLNPIDRLQRESLVRGRERIHGAR